MWFLLWIVRFLFLHFVGDYASMFMRGICGQFFSLNLFMRFWYSSVILTSQKGIRRCSFCFYFLGEIVENCYHFFLKFLICAIITLSVTIFSSQMLSYKFCNEKYPFSCWFWIPSPRPSWPTAQNPSGADSPSSARRCVCLSHFCVNCGLSAWSLTPLWGDFMWKKIKNNHS